MIGLIFTLCLMYDDFKENQEATKLELLKAQERLTELEKKSGKPYEGKIPNSSK